VRIERIYVACYKHDFRLTRILVASIRYWYPNIAITLLKDRRFGEFDSGEMERAWNVDVFPTNQTFGWGFAKLEPLFIQPRHRCLVLDSDIIFAGPVLDVLNERGEDFVVDAEELKPGMVEGNYFDLEKLRAFDPEFKFPGFAFNTGQFVATTGMFAREAMQGHIHWDSPTRLERPDIFKLGEQGFLNYWLMKQAAAGRITLARTPMMITPASPLADSVQVKTLTRGGERPLLMHWCGLRKLRLAESPRSDLLLHFQELYYSRIPGGKLRAKWRNGCYETIESLRAQWRKARA